MAQQYIGTGRLGAHQSVTYTGTAGTIANAITTGVSKVRVLVTTDAYIKIDNSPTAAITDVYLPALQAEYFTVTPGMKVSAVQAALAGTLHVTELA